MTRITPTLAALAATLVTLSACGERDKPLAYGYVEGEFRHVAPFEPGPIADLNVVEGQIVTAGSVLFTLDSAREKAALHEAEARLASAEARFDDAAAGGRAPEIEAARELLSQAQAAKSKADEDLDRGRALFDRGVIARARLDALTAEADAAAARVSEMRERLTLSQLPARENALRGLEADIQAAEAGVEAARRRLDDRTVRAPADGRVERILRRAGESAGPTAPVIRLLPEGALKVRFFVPENALNALPVGEVVAITCQGCPPGLVAEVTFRSNEAEFTPPVIYSNQERSRLVFLSEARLDLDVDLPVGLPVQVRSAGVRK